jgi:hypothetical protein
MSFTINAQNIFEYEKEIENKHDYTSEEIEIINTEENLKLYGVLQTPKSEFENIIIIVPGSGMDSRHSHYLLTQELLKNNIAVFRYDERGVGKSDGKFSTVTYGISKITNDLVFVINHLKKVKLLSNKLFGLIGHSQGGMATIGAYARGVEIDFLIQWATPIEKHGEFLKYQVKTGINKFDNELKFDNINKKLEIMDIVHKMVEQNRTDDDLTLSKKLSIETKKYGYKRKNYDRFKYFTLPAMKDLLRQNYESTYQNINIPILYLIGSEDKFVSPKANADLLKSYENKQINIKILNGLNHYLTKQEINPSNLKMSSSFYEMDKNALETIINWINNK